MNKITLILILILIVAFGYKIYNNKEPYCVYYYQSLLEHQDGEYIHNKSEVPMKACFSSNDLAEEFKIKELKKNNKYIEYGNYIPSSIESNLSLNSS